MSKNSTTTLRPEHKILRNVQPIITLANVIEDKNSDVLLKCVNEHMGVERKVIKENPKGHRFSPKLFKKDDVFLRKTIVIKNPDYWVLL